MKKIVLFVMSLALFSCKKEEKKEKKKVVKEETSGGSVSFN